jgi:phage-related holin
MAMGNYGEVGILAFGYFFGYFNIQLALVLVLVAHDCVFKAANLTEFFWSRYTAAI